MSVSYSTDPTGPSSDLVPRGGGIFDVPNDGSDVSFWILTWNISLLHIDKFVAVFTAEITSKCGRLPDVVNRTKNRTVIHYTTKMKSHAKSRENHFYTKNGGINHHTRNNCATSHGEILKWCKQRKKANIKFTPLATFFTFNVNLQTIFFCSLTIALFQPWFPIDDASGLIEMVFATPGNIIDVLRITIGVKECAKGTVNITLEGCYG